MEYIPQAVSTAEAGRLNRLLNLVVARRAALLAARFSFVSGSLASALALATLLTILNPLATPKVAELAISSHSFQSGAKGFFNNNQWGRFITSAVAVASWIPGPIGTVANAISLGIDVAQGDYVGAAASAVGMVAGGVAGKAFSRVLRFSASGKVVKMIAKMQPTESKVLAKIAPALRSRRAALKAVQKTPSWLANQIAGNWYSSAVSKRAPRHPAFY